MMQCIGEIQSCGMVAHGSFYSLAILNLDVWQRQQVGEHTPNFFATEFVVAAQHPLQLQKYRFRHYEGTTGFDQLAGKLALTPSRFIAIFTCHVVAGKNVGI